MSWSAQQRLETAYEDDRVWRQNQSIICQLYQEDKKTLKEVKEIMENEHGFPVTPISIWEVKLRQLGMRKKLKAKDWSLVYQHVRPRLLNEGKKKLRRPTAVLINGTKKSWEECWREFRRNQALGQGSHRGHLPPLPPGIVIRTPSPELLENAHRMQQMKSPEVLLVTLFQTTVVGFQMLLGPDSQPDAEPSDTLMRADSVYRLCLEGIPFTMLLEKTPDIIQGFLPSPSTIGRLEKGQHDRLAPPFSFPDNLATAWHPASWKSQLTRIIAQFPPLADSEYLNGRDLSLNFNNHHYLSIVLYLLSNKHVSDDNEEDSLMINAIFEMTFRFVSRRVLLALFQSRLLSIRAAWEQLLYWVGDLGNREAFSVVITVGIDNNWLEESLCGHEYLYHAVDKNCVDLVSTLLARGCRPASPFMHSSKETAIIAALDNGDLNCVRLLMQHCDVNRKIHGSTNFSKFIAYFDETNRDHLHCLNLFLEHGADVEDEVSQNDTRMKFDWCDVLVSCLMKYRALSILDYTFYFHRSIFPKMAAYGKVSGTFSRSRALWLLEQDVHLLREYVQESLTFARLEEEAGNNIDTREDGVCWLNILLAEQFLLARYIPKRRLHWEAVKGLLELGADLQYLLSTAGLASATFYTTAELITSGEGQYEEIGQFLMQRLLDHGFQVQADVLAGIAFGPFGGLKNLRCLAGFCSDLKQQGIKLLTQAVIHDDFETTIFLLDGGVDPNSTAVIECTKLCSIFGLAAMKSSLGMLQYLVSRGAKPGYWEHDGQHSDVLVRMFSIISSPDRFAKAQYIIEGQITVPEPFYPSAYLLEVCVSCSSRGLSREKRTMFEYLFKKGARLTPGSPMALWIAAGGGHQLVQEMLDAGADVNAYSSEIIWRGDGMAIVRRQLTPLQAAAKIGDYTLVCRLLERGADLNPPILGRSGTTALQEICTWNPVRLEERMRKDKIIRLFLEKGADVNAVSSKSNTALFCAARQGDLSTAFLLLKYGANPNAIYSRLWGGESALDGAAGKGRLDMVEFLLNANALSASASTDGRHYDGAIEKASRGGHFAVAELIRKHSADREREWAPAQEQATETTMLLDGEIQRLVVRKNSPTTQNRQADRQRTYGPTIHNIADLDESPQVYHDLVSATDDSEASIEVDVESMAGVEMTGLSCAGAIEEIEDESQLADIGREEALGKDVYKTTDQNTGRCEASLWTGGSLHQPEGQVSGGHEEQNDRQLIQGSLATDVFMGCSEFASP